MKMIEWAEEQGDVKGLVFKKMQVAGIALLGFYVFVFCAQDFKIVFYEFNGSNVVAPVTELYRIAAGARTDVGDFAIPGGAESFFDIMHGRAEFYLAMPCCETVFFVEFVVVFF